MKRRIINGRIFLYFFLLLIISSCKTNRTIHPSKSVFYCNNHKYILEVPIKKIDSYHYNNVDIYGQGKLYQDTSMSSFICGFSYSKELDKNYIEKFHFKKDNYIIKGGSMINRKSWIQIESHLCLLRLSNFNEQILDKVKMNDFYIAQLKDNSGSIK